MNKFLPFLAASFFVLTSNAQIQSSKKPATSSFFDEKTAIEEAIAKGINASEINGYVKFLKNDFSSKKSLALQKHVHSPYEYNQIQEQTIYLSPAKIASIDCPNMGFENNNFVGWTGSTGSVSIGALGAGSPVYNITSSVINNGAGNNISLTNTTNYHTMMTTPPSNYLYPNCIGYDSIGCTSIGTNTISQIPVVSPFSSDGVSVRMLGAVANYRASVKIYHHNLCYEQKIKL
jgi:hypothetical protein